MPRITIIGGGAYIFPLVEVRDILSFPALQDSTICLYDINEERNSRNAVGVEKMIEMYDLPAKLEATTNREQALTNADFCVCTFQVGGVEAFAHDVEIPRRYGIDQCVGDTFGPGGIFRGLRSIAAMQEIAADMHRLCPNALFLQYANPMAINSWGMSRLGIANIGFCHSVQGTSRMLAREMGIPFDKCSFIVAGLNHQAWFTDYRCEGIDVMPLLRQTMMQKHLAGQGEGETSDALRAGGGERVRTEIMQLTGHFHTESSQHASEYLGYFRKNPELVLEYLPKRWDFYEICKNHPEETRVADFLEDLEGKELTPGHEFGAFVIDSMVTGTLRLVYGSVPNRNIITNIPNDCSVEVPVMVDRQGLRPQVIGDLPPACAAVTRLGVNTVQLTVEAALTGDRDLLHAAVALDPLTAAILTLPQIRELVDDMIEAQQQWLPQFTGKTVVTAGADDLRQRFQEGPAD